MMKTIDRDIALKRIDGDEELYSELVTIFLETVPNDLCILDEAANKGDAELTRRQAHSLKSAAAAIGAISLQEIAFGIEQLVQQQGTQATIPHLAILQKAFIEIKEYFSGFTL